MSKILQFDAYIVNKTNHTQVLLDMGKYYVGVPVDTGLRNASIASPVAEGDYNVFAGLVDNLASFGGDIACLESQATLINNISQYVPYVSGNYVSIASGNLSDMALKLVNSRGQYALKPLTAVANAFELYNADGTYLRGSSGYVLPLSSNGFSINSTALSWVGIWVQGFDQDDRFSPDYDIYYMTFRADTRAFTRSTLNASYKNDARVIAFLNNAAEYTIDTDDPYDGAGDSTTGGGGGTFDYDSNVPGGADDFTPPGINAVDAGFITLFNPTNYELKQLADYLWSNSFDIGTMFKKLFNDPMDIFLGLSIVPVAVPDGALRSVGIGLIDTGVTMHVAASQWVKVPCGQPVNSKGQTTVVPNFSGSYLDYDPYTQIEIYLPFIGVRSLKADEVVGRSLKVTYWVDILSGACVAWIDVNGVPLYTYMGQCATNIPISGGDWTNIINGVLSVVGGAVGGAVKGGVGGAIAGGVAATSAVAITDGKISVERSGTISSSAGLLAPQKPYLVISAPRLCKPEKQNTFEGYPLYVTKVLNKCKGFTQVEKIHLKDIYGLDEELTEIVSLLKEGVII